MARPGLPKLIATDLDGTLVRSDDTVSAFTHEVLDRVRAAGIRIVGATGRGPRLTELTTADIAAADFLVMAHGGWVLDQTDRRFLTTTRMPGQVLAERLADLEAEVGPLTVMVEALEHSGAPLWGVMTPGWPYEVTVEERTRTQCLTGDVIKAYACTPGHHVDELLAIARRVIPAQMASITQAGLDVIEICPPGVDKATGLSVVAEAVGVDPDDVLVFGDMPNDLPMFAWAGWQTVAVANAHPDVLAAADDVTETNDEDGVARFLDRLLSR
ncbi:HAD family hydrolase [Mangrovihabitans endophyticus]|uniref:Hydrolase n=1 Tax=Mangrovihabitans endophyticus TaxID=1751298 RepID=A0A8J3FPY3_9ACTN|nr:HAD family hydrolase [Mangrovihabitans endophyticus]GGK93748.1 hydrolase [Mangrovihabitans endophyticus]